VKRPQVPITDDHIHIDPQNGRGLEAAKDFQRAGGTHMMLVTKPSWSFGIIPRVPEDFQEVFDRTLFVADQIRDLGIQVFPILGVHPAEITRLCGEMPLSRVVTIMSGALDLAAEYVREGRAVGLKSGRPHYLVESEVLDASNQVLAHALHLGASCECAVQVHAESGPCSDLVAMAADARMPIDRLVKHYAIPETPLHPSLIATHEAIPTLWREGRRFTLESDFMDENSRPGAVLGPKSVPRTTFRLLEERVITEEDVYRIHATIPFEVYGVEIHLP
jgi:TatD-related deoxyribonuclease